VRLKHRREWIKRLFQISLLILFSAFAFLERPAMADELLRITPAILDNLEKLKPELNFGPDQKTFYTGVPDPADRAIGDVAFAQLVDVLVANLARQPSKEFVLQQFQIALSKFSSADTEDRERAAGYCEKIMDVVGIESSDGVLNRWLYGPIISDLLKKKP
jgi:hypothetical protein